MQENNRIKFFERLALFCDENQFSKHLVMFSLSRNDFQSKAQVKSQAIFEEHSVYATYFFELFSSDFVLNA